MRHSYRLVRVTKSELRRKFREGDYQGKVERGELNQKILKDGHPSPPRAAEPYCTRSQIIAYLDRSGKKLAIAHRYLRPNGELGASGRPDPKTIREGNTIFLV